MNQMIALAHAHMGISHSISGIVGMVVAFVGKDKIVACLENQSLKGIDEVFAKIKASPKGSPLLIKYGPIICELADTVKADAASK